MPSSAVCTLVVSVTSQPVNSVSAPRLSPCLRNIRRSSCRAAGLARTMSRVSISLLMVRAPSMSVVGIGAAGDHRRQRLWNEDDERDVHDQEADDRRHAEKM